MTSTFEEPVYQVKCIRDVHPFFTQGEIYEVVNRDPENIMVINNYLENHLIVSDDDWTEFDKYFEIYY